ncbi:gliding motility-associated C-terminal domain-containing protein [Ekhidna sp.]
MPRWIHIALLIILPATASSQAFSSKGRFSVEFDRGCSPVTINITEHDGFGDVTRQYFYFEGAGITSSQTFTYQETGTFEIVQVIGSDLPDDKTDTLIVNVLESIKPQIEITKCSNLDISVTSKDSYYDSIRVYFTTTDSVTLVNNQKSEFSFSSPNLVAIGLKGFFDNADEVCSTYFEELLPISSIEAPQILSASIKETCKDIFSMYLELAEVDTLVRYRVILDQSGETTLFDNYLFQSTLVLSDIPFTKSNYCIQVESYDPCNDVTQRSSAICAEPSQLSLSPFETLYSTYDSAGIFINLDEVNVGTFDVYRRIQGQEFELRSQNSSSFTDPIGSLSRQYFYKIDYIDSCGQVLYSAETNPPLIESDEIEPNQYLARFTQPVNSIDLGISNEYRTGTTFSQSTGDINSPEFPVSLNAKDGSPRQFISATSSYTNGLILTSNSEAVRYELIIYVPKAFTPNGDGLNDHLELFGLPTEDAVTNIYSRWGQLVYSSDQPSPGWDGTISGSLADEGTYLYEIIFETVSGEKRRQKGTFTLIKK